MELPGYITPCTSNLHLHSNTFLSVLFQPCKINLLWCFFIGSVIPQAFTPLGDTSWDQVTYVACTVDTCSGLPGHSDALWVDVNEALDSLAMPVRLYYWVRFNQKLCHWANGYTMIPTSIWTSYSLIQLFDFRAIPLFLSHFWLKCLLIKCCQGDFYCM